MFESIRKLLSSGARKKSFIDNSNGIYASRGNTFAFFKNGRSFDNTYPSITKIANEFLKTRPYAIDNNGKPMQNVRLINKLYHPNQQMSSVDFREALAVMALVHPKVYLLAWREEGGKAVPGGQITTDNIAGFTFLEGVNEVTMGGKKTYRVGGYEYGTNEVIEILGGVEPYDLSKGYSPSSAVAKWASLDDYIATYQAGFFENGAVPAGEFIITANSVPDYNKIVDEMQKRHRGSGRNNNVVYTHRPINPTTGSPVDAQIQWVPFGQSNKDMSLKEVFQQANNKIDSAFGVPASIRGVNDNNTYASVRVDEQIFIKYAVEPFATKIWARFTHEMNRITGGLGFAIVFDMDIPGVAEEEKVEADRKLVELSIIDKGLSMGYALGSIVDAFGLSKGYKNLSASNTPIKNDKPDVDDGGETEASPTHASTKTIEPKNGCSCGSCQHKHKAAPPDNQKVVDDVAEVTRDFMQKQIDGAIEGNGLNKDVNDAEEKDITSMVTAILSIIIPYMLLRGAVSYKDGIALLVANDIPIDNTSEYIVSEITKSDYRAYLTNVTHSYAEDTATNIRNILARGQTEGWDKETIARNLRDIMNTDEWRVQRLARTEEHRSVGNASIDAMTQLMHEASVVIRKTWHTNSSDPCEFCKAMDGKSEIVNRSFLPVGQSVEGADGGTFVNNFVDVDSASLHPHCNCYVMYEIEQQQ